MKKINILILGDVVGHLGRKTLGLYLPSIKQKYNIDFTIANNENATHGHGCSFMHYKELIKTGIDCFTSGNHFNGVKYTENEMELMNRQVRPMNFPDVYPLIGSRLYLFEGIKIRVSNLLGSAFISLSQNNPFTTFENFINCCEDSDIHIVDFHAEATGEKRAFAEFFDGKVTCIFGTHTHVQTADEQILNKGTAFITDVGMCGASDSILGVEKQRMILKAAYSLPAQFKFPESGPAIICGAVLTYDLEEKKVVSFTRVNEKIKLV